MITTVFLKHPVIQQISKVTALTMKKEHLTTVLRTEYHTEHLVVLVFHTIHFPDPKLTPRKRMNGWGIHNGKM